MPDSHPFSKEVSLTFGLVEGATLVSSLLSNPDTRADLRIVANIADQVGIPPMQKTKQFSDYLLSRHQFDTFSEKETLILGGVHYAETDTQRAKLMHAIFHLSDAVLSNVLRVVPANDVSNLYPLVYEYGITKEQICDIEKNYPSLGHVVAPAFEYSQKIQTTNVDLDDLRRLGHVARAYSKSVEALFDAPERRKEASPDDIEGIKKDSLPSFYTSTTSCLRAAYASSYLTKITLFEPLLDTLINGKVDPQKAGTFSIEKLLGPANLKAAEPLLTSRTVAYDRDELITKSRAAYTDVIVYNDPYLTLAAIGLPNEAMIQAIPVEELKPTDPRLVEETFGAKTFASLMRAALEA